MAKHRQTATGRKEVGSKKDVEAVARARSPVREISLVRRAGVAISSSGVSSVVSSTFPSRAPSPTPRQPFRFFDLPSELRLRVYELLLLVPKPVDLDPVNYRLILPRLALFLVSRRMHEEAYRVFYAQTIRLFPYHDRFFHTKKPLLERLPVAYRNAITCMELRLGPGWSAPPRCQHTKPSLGLMDCKNMRTLKVFVDCDPSDSIFAGFRGKNATEETYKYFCVELLLGIFEQVPSLETVEIDAYPAVKKDAPLIAAFVRHTRQWNKRVGWGPLRGWEKDGDEPGLIGLEKAMASMGISSDLPSMVEVHA